MNTWSDQSFFAALDWASNHHDIAVVDRSGQLVLEFRFDHSAQGWAEFAEKMRPFTGCPLALETSSGPAVDQPATRVDALPGQSQSGGTLPGTQSAERNQNRPA